MDSTTRALSLKEPIGKEEWQEIPTFLRMGIAVCEHLAPWRAAHLTVKHRISARGWKELPRDNGSFLYHVTTRWPSGQEEDPSEIFRMR